MSELKFNRVNNEEYKTTSVFVENAIMKIVEDDYFIFDIHKTKYGYRKGNIRINNEDLIDNLKIWEVQINKYLKNEMGTGAITILYGNRIYPKVLTLVGQEKEEHHIKIKSIWINENNKPFVQLYYVHNS